jgi:hypothetical protein
MMLAEDISIARKERIPHSQWNLKTPHSQHEDLDLCFDHARCCSDWRYKDRRVCTLDSSCCFLFSFFSSSRISHRRRPTQAHTSAHIHIAIHVSVLCRALVMLEGEAAIFIDQFVATDSNRHACDYKPRITTTQQNHTRRFQCVSLSASLVQKVTTSGQPNQRHTTLVYPTHVFSPFPTFTKSSGR